MPRLMTLYKVLLFLLCLPSLVMAQGRQRKDIPVKVVVNIGKETDRPNLVLYRKERLLKSADFKGRPDPFSPGVGATYSGILMEMEGKYEQGILVTYVTLTVYFDASQSWLKREGKNDRVLAHEQIHFDLTAIKACDLAKAITAQKFDYKNLKQRLRELHKQQTGALKRLQKDYDAETGHGTNAAKQAEWSARIAEAVAGLACF